jgi:hypothetical protein
MDRVARSKIARKLTSAAMSHGHEPTHYPPPAEGMKFADEEWQDLQAEDRHAARAVVGLMAGIFTTGLFIYSVVALIVSGAM